MQRLVGFPNNFGRRISVLGIWRHLHRNMFGIFRSRYFQSRLQLSSDTWFTIKTTTTTTEKQQETSKKSSYLAHCLQSPAKTDALAHLSHGNNLVELSMPSMTSQSWFGWFPVVPLLCSKRQSE